MIMPVRLHIPNGHAVRIRILLAIKLLKCLRGKSGTRVQAMIWGRRTDKEGGRRIGYLEGIRARAGLTDISFEPEYLHPKSFDLWSRHDIVPKTSTSFTQNFSHSSTTATTKRFYTSFHRFPCERVWLSFCPRRTPVAKSYRRGRSPFFF